MPFRSSSTSRTTSPPPGPSTPGGSLSTSISTQILNNMFKSLVIEGSIKKGEGPVKLKLYAKIAVPATPPQQSYPLFPESDIRLVKYAIHPLDGSSTPYAFPPNASPLLHRAARVLNLKPASDVYYDDALAASRGHHTSQRGPHEMSPAIIGEIVVRNFHICFRSPKFTVASSSDSPQTDPDGSFHKHRRRTSFGASTSSSQGAGSSSQTRFGERSDCYYVIALELKVPLASRPPSNPYMIRIPTPRCLSNQIKLRMPPVPLDGIPPNSSALSDDGPSWDIMTIPNVNPTLAQSRRRNSTASIESWADDEDGWSEGGPDAEGPIIEGTFPASQEHSSLIVRWALSDSVTTISSPAQRSQRQRSKAPRKRVKLRHVESSMTYTIGTIQNTKDFHEDGEEPIRVVLVDMDYSARCEGISHPGVETELALEVGLDGCGTDVYWPRAEEDKCESSPLKGMNQWTVTADKGYKGWQYIESESELVTEDPVELETGHRRELEVGDLLPPDSPSPGNQPLRSNSQEEDAIEESIATNRSFKRPRSLTGHSTTSGSISSLTNTRHSASLLRAPLPSPNTIVDEYSFENPSLTAMEPPLAPFHLRRPSSSVFTTATSTTTSSGDGAASQRSGPLSRSMPNFGTSTLPLARTESESTTMSGVSSVISGMAITTDWDSSPTRPRSFASGHAPSRTKQKRSNEASSEAEPSQEMVINIDLLALLESQHASDSDAAVFRFGVKGRVVLVLPPSSGEKVNVQLPVFRLAGLEDHAEHQCMMKVVAQDGAGSPMFALVEKGRNMKMAAIRRDWWDGQGDGDGIEVSFLGWKKPPLSSLRKSFAGLVGRRQSSVADPGPYRGMPFSPTKTSPSKKQDESDITLQPLDDEEFGPASDLIMPHPFATPSSSPLHHQPDANRSVGNATGSKSLTSQSDKRHSETSRFKYHRNSGLDSPTISFVKVEAMPLQTTSPDRPARDKDIGRSSRLEYLVHLRLSWPFTAQTGQPSPYVGIGFAAPPTSRKPIQIDVKSAHFGAITVQGRLVNPNLYTSGLERGGDDVDWLSWFEFNLPEGCNARDGELEILYIVESDGVGPKGQYINGCIPVILPCIAAGIAKIEVDVSGLAREHDSGINLKTNLRLGHSDTPNLLRDFCLSPLAPLTLALEPQRGSKFGRWSIPRRTSSILSVVWQIWHFILTLGLVLLVWNMSSEIRDMKGLSRTADSPSLGGVLGQSQSSQPEPPSIRLPSGIISTVASSSLASSAATSTAVPLEKYRQRSKPAETFNVPDDIWGDRNWVTNLEKEESSPPASNPHGVSDSDHGTTPLTAASTTLRQAMAQLRQQNVTLLCTSTAKTVVQRTKDILVFIFNYTV